MKSKVKDKLVIFGIVLVLLITIVSVSYGFLTVTKTGKSHKVVAGIFDIRFDDKEGETVKLERTYPMTDDEGMSTPSYDFTIENKGDVDASYTLRLENDNSIQPKDRLNATQIKYSIKIGDSDWTTPALLSTTKSGQTLVDNETLSVGSGVVKCSLRLWVDENVGNEGQNKGYSSKLVLEAVQGNLDTNVLPNTTSPLILLNGDYSENVEQGGTYIDLGIREVKDDKDTLRIEDVEKSYEFYNGDTTNTVENIDTNNIGVYYITYKISDNDGNEGVVVRSVNVYKPDTTAPTIELIGQRTISIAQDSIYNDEGATATDLEEGDLTDRIVTIGTVNTKVPGTYTIKYVVTDNEGNTASISRTVIVEANGRVTVTFIKSSGVQDIEVDDLSCEITTGDDCEITLPKITSLLGYDEGFFTVDESATTGNKVGTTIRVSESTNYYAKALDTTKPVCSINSQSPEAGEITTEDTVEITFECTDTSGSIVDDLTEDKINFTIDGSEATVTKSLSTGTSITNGKSYVLSLSELQEPGELAFTIGADSVHDASNNGNERVSATTGYTIVLPDFTGSLSEFLEEKTNSYSATYTKDTKHDMFLFEQPSTVQLGEVTDYRYIGDDPYNYVEFNGERWRIIGVFDDLDKDGNQEQRFKIMRDASIGNKKWDSGWTNNWNRPASLRSDSDFISAINGIDKDKIENMTWFLGALQYDTKNTYDIYYKAERSNTVAGKNGSTKSVASLVGLMYPSDWAYTYGKGVHDECFNAPSDSDKCGTANAQNSWMFTSNHTSWHEWMLTSYAEHENGVFRVRTDGIIGGNSSGEEYGVRPVIYLKSGVEISGGNGTYKKPYKLSYNSSASEELVNNANSKDTEYNENTKHEMFCFEHGATDQTPSQIDCRYIGSDPYNYVTFNGEKAGWRIIGVFNVQSSLNGAYEQRIKLIRDERLPSDQDNNISWDNTYTSSNTNVNDWENAALKTLLNDENGIYWNRQSGNCPYGENNGTTICDFSSVGLTSEAQAMIGNTKWYLGASSSDSAISTETFYANERSSTQVGAKGNTHWVGKVGLIYPSDFGFTYANGIADECYETLREYSECGQANAAKSWMWAPEKSSTENHNNWSEWTLTSLSDYTYYVLGVNSRGSVDYWRAYYDIGVRPVVYLKSNVILKGNVDDDGKAPGSKDNPYTFEMPNDPYCYVDSITPDSPTTYDEVKVKINCMDYKSEVTSTMKKSDIDVKVNGKIVNLTTKNLSTSSKIDNGIQHTLTLKGFESTGLLSLTIKEGAVTNTGGLKNKKTTITVGPINEQPKIVGLPVNSDDAKYADDTKHKMFVFEQPETSQLGATTDYRYIGDDPYNYVTFNGEKAGWRIIGVFEDPDENGIQEQRIKLMRDDYYPAKTWDALGSNNWARPASLRSDSDFIKASSGSDSKKVETMTWYLGSGPFVQGSSTKDFYMLERSSTVAGASGSVESVADTVGLMYPSDWGYTYANGVSSICYNELAYKSSGACDLLEAKKSWIFTNHSSWYEALLTVASNNSDFMYGIDYNGYIGTGHVDSNGYGIRPVVYLKAGVQISSGDGSKENPYILGKTY